MLPDFLNYLLKNYWYTTKLRPLTRLSTKVYFKECKKFKMQNENAKYKKFVAFWVILARFKSFWVGLFFLFEHFGLFYLALGQLRTHFESFWLALGRFA